MGKTTITKPFLESAQLQELGNAIAVSQNRINLDGLIGSSLSIAIAESFKTADKPFLVILNDKEEATYILNDLEQLVKEDHVLFYPGSYRRPYQIEGTDNANILFINKKIGQTYAQWVFANHKLYIAKRCESYKDCLLRDSFNYNQSYLYKLLPF